MNKLGRKIEVRPSRTFKQSGKWAASFAAAALAGCTVGPDYKPPTANMPPGFGELGGSAAATQPATQPSVVSERRASLARWWTTFNDPTLNGLIDRAIRSNLDLRRAQSRILQARAQRAVTSAGLFPLANFSGSASRSRSSANAFGGSFAGTNASTSGGSAGSTGTGGGTGGSVSGGGGSAPSVVSTPGLEQSFYQVGFDASWELDVFGGLRRSIEAADADIAAAIEDQRDTLVTLTAEVARTYIELRGFQRQIAIARENLEAQRGTAQITHVRERGGASSRLDVVRAEAQVATTASQIPTLETSARQAIHALGVLLGEQPMALSEELSRELPIPTTPPEVPVGLPSELLRRRPDVRRAERQLAAATARVGVAVADLFPKFSLTGSYGLESTKFKKLTDYDSRLWSIGPALSWPIFDFGRIRGNIQAQNAAQAQAVAAYEQTVLTGLKEVEDALVAYSKEQVRRKALSDAVDANREAANLAEQLNRGGATDFLSVLVAQRDLFASQDAMVQSDRQVSANLVALYKALGGGWEVAAPAAPK